MLTLLIIVHAKVNPVSIPVSSQAPITYSGGTHMLSWVDKQARLTRAVSHAWRQGLYMCIIYKLLVRWHSEQSEQRERYNVLLSFCIETTRHNDSKKPKGAGGGDRTSVRG